MFYFSVILTCLVFATQMAQRSLNFRLNCSTSRMLVRCCVVKNVGFLVKLELCMHISHFTASFCIITLRVMLAILSTIINYRQRKIVLLIYACGNSEPH